MDKGCSKDWYINYFPLYFCNHTALKNVSNTRAIRNVTSGELLTKRSMRKKMVLYAKNMYILKLLFNTVAAGIEALVLGNKSLYASVKEVWYLRSQPHFETFHHLIFFLYLHSGGGIKVHSTLRPLNGLLCQPRVIMIMEKSVE
jgi:hypothetical protein